MRSDKGIVKASQSLTIRPFKGLIRALYAQPLILVNCLDLFEIVTSKKLTLTASDSGFEAIKSSGTLVGFDSDGWRVYRFPGERAMKERLFFHEY